MFKDKMNDKIEEAKQSLDIDGAKQSLGIEEDSTAYGEWVASANSWMSMDEQRERVREIDESIERQKKKK